MKKSKKTSWPKIIPPLTNEQIAIRDDFMKHWLTVLPKKYGIIEKFNHGFASKKGIFQGCNTLEIGAGLGEHLFYENLAIQNYSVIEIREELIKEIKIKYPQVKTLVGDCQKKTSFEDNSFDRILAIHVLEHLPDLPSALKEIHRLLKTDGKFIAVIPCEGGLLYEIARKISARRIFEKRYNQSYDWLISIEHINLPLEIIIELKKFFLIEETSYFPLIIPSISMNLCIGLVLSKKEC
ncbi:class I SAM-dependent methyltransferase [Methanospirillum stamsii]|uniref:Class I SAM-dependent methyltransferase n=1 Tax=Methanospirillum stamsii TaxID=1277351 RepID=A0A2V2N8B4_9EURY|nr:class I SAM-dependent methyltransferase [Methanospirillum stamsii]PWR76214.1 class I SAM-dependent methyltransferase [Methanospirillum stamsii]